MTLDIVGQAPQPDELVRMTTKSYIRTILPHRDRFVASPLEFRSSSSHGVTSVTVLTMPFSTVACLRISLTRITKVQWQTISATSSGRKTMTSWCDAMPAARMQVSPSRCMSLTLQCNLQADFEKRANPNDKAQAALLEEMRAHVKKVKQRQFPTFAPDAPGRRVLSQRVFLCSLRRSVRMKTHGYLSPHLSSRRHRGPSQSASRCARRYALVRACQHDWHHPGY